MSAETTVKDFYLGNVDSMPVPQRPAKPDFFREPKNYFGVNITTVNPVIGPHWHPNADEFDYFLSGKGRVGIIEPAAPKEDPKDTVFEFPVTQGDVIVIPQGYAHYYINDGGADDPLKFLAVFNNTAFRLVNTSQVPEPSVQKS